jgi:hypothetical protein
MVGQGRVQVHVNVVYISFVLGHGEGGVASLQKET